MPGYDYTEVKNLLELNAVSDSQFWDLVKKSLIADDSKLTEDLLKYGLNQYPTYSLEIFSDLFNTIPLEKIYNSIDLIKKLGVSTSYILNAALKIDTHDNPQLDDQKEEIIAEIIKSEPNKTFQDIENDYRRYYNSNISLEDLRKVKELTLLKNPDAALHIALSDATQNQSLRIEFVEKLLSNGANINKLLQADSANNLKVLSELADHLLNHSLHPVNPQSFLNSVLAASTLEYNYFLQKITLSKELVKMKYDLVQQCVNKGASISNQLTVFFDEEHVFVKLDCSNCDKGEAASVYVGLYPPSLKESDEQCFIQGEDHNKNADKVQSASLAYLMARPLSGYIFKLQNTHIALPDKIPGEKYVLMQEFEGGLSKSSLNFGDNRDQRSYQDLQNMPQKSFNISKEAADKLFARIDHLVNTCDKDLEYQVFGSNCIDFAQDVFKQSGLAIDIVEEVHGIRYPQNIFGIYKAIQDTSRAITGDGSAIRNLSNFPTSPLVTQTLQDLIPQVELARVMYPAISSAIGMIAASTSSAYKYLFGSKISKEELDHLKFNLGSTKPQTLKMLDQLRKEFMDIRRETYTRDLEVANSSYNERIHKYTSLQGEEAISRVRFMADLDNEFRDLSKKMLQLVKAQKALTSDANDITAKQLVALDKEIEKRIINLAKKDLNIIAKNDTHKAKLQALQSQLTPQSMAKPNYVKKESNSKERPR